MKTFTKMLEIFTFIVVIVYGITACNLLSDDEGDDDKKKESAYGWYGNGSSNIFTISNSTQLIEFSKIVSGTAGADGPSRSDFSGKTVTLTSDINMSGISWSPIGLDRSVYYPFNGTFDGNNRTVSNLRTDGSLSTEFFMIIGEDGTVKNIVFSDIDLNTTFGSTGLIYINRGLIQNISINGSINAVQYAGGIVLENYGIVENCNFSGIISGSGGGIVYDNRADAVVRNCYVIGSMDGRYSGAGGIVGKNSGTVQNCYTICNVNVTGGQNEVGGIVGKNNGIIENCYATGSVSGNWYVGGIAGDNRSGSIRNCVALNPSINASNIQNYILGRVSDNYTSSPRYSNNYALSGMIMRGNYIVVPDPNGPDGADVSAEDAATQSWWTANLNWDFNNVWQWDSSRNLPKLR